MPKFKFENNVVICGGEYGSINLIPLKYVQYITVDCDDITFAILNGKTLTFKIQRTNDEQFKVIETITKAFLNQFRTTTEDLLSLETS